MTVARLLELRREYLDNTAVLGDLFETYGGREHVPADRWELGALVARLSDLAVLIADVDLGYLGIKRRQGEAAVIAVGPRPGSWFGDKHADGRMLTQEQTDILIRFELHGQTRWLMDGPTRQNADLMALLGPHQQVEFLLPALHGDMVKVAAQRQRGGISTDPVIRMLAFRAWVDRDERWFEDRGVRRGDALATTTYRGSGRADHEVGAAWPHDASHGTTTADHDACPGQMVMATTAAGPRRYRVGDRLREQAGSANAHGLVVGDTFFGPPEGFGIPVERPYPAPTEHRVVSVDTERFKLESTTKAPVASGASHNPGMRRPGTKLSPPVPRWARKRRGDRW